MTLKEAKGLIGQGENEHIEFKRRIAYPEKVVKELVAFANTTGGHLIIGVNDDGHLSGLKYPEEDVYALNEALKRLTRPKIGLSWEILALSEKKSIVVYQVPSSAKKPHFVLPWPKARFGKAYVRVNDRSVKASREVREILKGKRRNQSQMFEYGSKEKILMDYLRKNERISLQEYTELAKVPIQTASKTLVSLTLANVLSLTPGEEIDYFFMKS